MKRFFLFAVLLIATCQLYAQQKTAVHGRLLNFKEHKLEIVASTGTFTDSIPVQPDGTFTYRFRNMKAPMRLSITNRKQVQIQLFVAPGYNLDLIADVKDYETAKKTLQYRGLGSQSNSYWTKMMKSFQPDTVKWHLKSTDEYIRHLLQPKKIDSLIATVFDAENKEPYAAYFKRSLLLDQKYGLLLTIYNNYAYQKKLKWVEIETMLPKLGFTAIAQDLNNSDNLTSATFSYLVSEYPFYCEVYNAFPGDSTAKTEGNYSLYLSSKIFKGKVYDFVAGKKIASMLTSIYKQSDFEKLDPYLNKISDANLKADLLKARRDRLVATSKLSAGLPSPLFNLPDTSGTMHSLTQFKGKVVYIDLWASWCGPCKEETPYLKKVYEMYQSNPNIAIISIASFDAKNRKIRHELIKKDQMEWLQLEDTTDSFAKSYQANFIPRFIIIDKKGNIVDSDAVRPSETEKLAAILNRELKK